VLNCLVFFHLSLLSINCRYKERQQLQVHEAMSSGIIVRKIERLPDQSLLIRKVSLEDQGLYTCRAINDYGQDIKDVQLEIFGMIEYFLRMIFF
jgi:hypothetical protein